MPNRRENADLPQLVMADIRTGERTKRIARYQQEGAPSWRKHVSKVKKYRAVGDLQGASERRKVIKSLDFMSPDHSGAVGAIGRSTDLIELA